MILRLLLLSACVASAAPVSFRAEVAPLLQRRCATCHSAENPKGRYKLDTFARLMKPGQSDLPAVTPGKPAASEIAALLREMSATDRMPQKADALPEAEIALIERWIAEGAHFDGKSKDQPLVELVRDSMLRPAPQKYARPLPITALAFSPDGTRLAASGYYEITMWNVSDGALTARLDGLPERITSLAWHGERLAVAGGSPMQWGTVALADAEGKAPPKFLCDLAETALSVAFSADGSHIAAGSGDRTVRVFDASGRKLRVLKPHADWVQDVAFSPDGSHLLTASRDRTARVLDLKSGEATTSYTGHDTPLLACAFAADGAAWTLARGSTMHRWDSAKAKRDGEIKGAEWTVFCAGSSGFVAASGDRKLRFFPGSERTPKATWDAPGDAVLSLAMSGDGKLCASGAANGTVAVFALPEGKLLRMFVAAP
ncbi:MAG: c-type cytochrome domain-containing protein [Chthoniobacteraceae bacterium]